jgi:tetratricopeptide (TPR) repeat protein/predicted Ser/Thr protein kinase
MMTEAGGISQAGLPGRIGDFRILSLLGEGGMGRVYLAEQSQPQRQVALKVIRTLASGDFAQRFRREVELLAGLEHPNIARVYAAGTAATESGDLPYLAMEYVRGEELTAYAQQHQPDLATRVGLLVQICRAVHYAHTRGVIHRDLKPGNILIYGSGQPKILDFGVARAVGEEERTRMTVAGEIIGTLPYMSAEQLGGDSRRVDPRTDVYSLGVIAYELLAGRLPYPGLSKSTLIGALDMVRNSDPPRLSQLVAEARGDLETIVMKAMAREPGARYDSAAELAADLERYLTRQPIAARPPTARYLLRLFVQRHRALTAAAGFAVLVLLLSTAVSLRFAYSEARARGEAELRSAELAAVNEFLRDMFTAADPERALGEKLTVRDVLDVARREIAVGGTLPAPVVQQLRRSLGNTYVSLGLAPQGLELLEAAAGDGAPTQRQDRLQLELDTARALKEAGRESDAKQRLQALLEETAGDAAVQPLWLGAQVELAAIEILEGFPKQAETRMREALPIAEQRLGPTHDLSLMAGYNLALALHHDARYDDSRIEAQRVVAQLQARFGNEHPRVQLARDVIALNHREQARFKEAEAIYRETIVTRERVLGPDHPQTHAARVSLAAVMALDGRAAEAADLARAAHESMKRQLGPDAELTRNVASLRAYVVSETGAWAEAVDIYRGSIDQAERNPGGPTVTDLPDYNNLGNALKKLDRYGEAATVFEQLVRLAEPLVGREHLHYGLFELNYADTLIGTGRRVQARPLIEHSLTVLTKELGPDHPRTQRARELLKQASAG